MTSSKGETPTSRPTDDDSEPTAPAIEPGAVAATEESTEEWNVEDMGEEFVEMSAETRAETSGRAIVARVIDDHSSPALSAPERAIRRERRATVESVVPSMLAKSMRPSTVVQHRPGSLPPFRPTAPSAPAPSPFAVPIAIGAAPTAPMPVRDPAAPSVEHVEVTRRVPDSALDGAPDDHSATYGVEVVARAPGVAVAGADADDVHDAPTAEQDVQVLGPVAALVKKACFCLDVGDVAQAVTAAAAALAASEESDGQVENNVANLADTASGPLARIFTAGPISKVPVMNRSDAELDSLSLDELHWALLRRLDGKTTFDEVFRATKIPAIDALKIAASLLRDGVIRVDDRARA
jgi:hypothetical protein